MFGRRARAFEAGVWACVGRSAEDMLRGAGMSRHGLPSIRSAVNAGCPSEILPECAGPYKNLKPLKPRTANPPGFYFLEP